MIACSLLASYFSEKEALLGIYNHAHILRMCSKSFSIWTEDSFPNRKMCMLSDTLGQSIDITRPEQPCVLGMFCIIFSDRISSYFFQI